jgi:hypothetical protein
MVLEKESSVLGYPGEVSKALSADHHGICKYEGPLDPNYIAIRNVLKSLVGKILTKDNSKHPELSERRAALKLKSLFALSELAGLDYIFFRDQWTEDTNNWINTDKTLLQWRDSQDNLSVLWLNGGPATGKSILVSTIINNLVQDGCRCQYFFALNYSPFRSGVFACKCGAATIHYRSDQRAQGSVSKFNALPHVDRAEDKAWSRSSS